MADGAAGPDKELRDELGMMCDRIKPGACRVIQRGRVEARVVAEQFAAILQSERPHLMRGAPVKTLHAGIGLASGKPGDVRIAAQRFHEFANVGLGHILRALEHDEHASPSEEVTCLRLKLGKVLERHFAKSRDNVREHGLLKPV